MKKKSIHGFLPVLLFCFTSFSVLLPAEERKAENDEPEQEKSEKQKPSENTKKTEETPKTDSAAETTAETTHDWNAEGVACFQGTEETPPDFRKAFELFKKGAEAGDPAAMLNLGILYASGQGTEKNTEKALEYIRMAAEKGDTMAMLNLASAYLGGGNVMPPDGEKALQWLERAAEEDEIQAWHLLGMVFLKGIAQVGKNPEKAAGYFRRGAEKGDLKCMDKLGFLYYMGRGVETTPVTLPSPGQSSAAETSMPGPERVELTSENVAAVLAELTRAESYSGSVTIEDFWDGGSASTRSPRNILVSEGTLYIWYDNVSGVFSGPWEGSADEWLRALSYEDVLSLPPEQITGAGYAQLSGEECVYVDYTGGLLGYTYRVYVSVSNGLLMGAEKYDGGSLIYRMFAEYELSVPDESLFVPPEG